MYGEAVLLAHATTGQKVVVKHVLLDGLEEGEVRCAVSEAAALNKLSHPNIVQCLGSWISVGSIDGAMSRPWVHGSESARLPIDDDIQSRLIASIPKHNLDYPPISVNILTEYVDGGSLEDLIARQATPFEEACVGCWLTQIIFALDHMHQRSLLHRDIKPANIFITKSGVIKLGDLGCCKVLQRPDEACSSDYGSPLYLSPEVWQQGVCSHKSDIWSVGCVLYALLALRAPFSAPDLADKVKTSVPELLPAVYSSSLRTLALEMLQKNPSARPGTLELLRHPAMNGYIDSWQEVAFDNQK